MGNSRGTASEAKNRLICKRFYVTEAEDQQIEQLCQGVSQSRYFRSRVLARQMPRPKALPPQVNREIYIHLAGIRSRLDQLARMITSSDSTTNPAAVVALVEQLAHLNKLLVEVQLQLSQAEQTGEAEHDWQDHEE